MTSEEGTLRTVVGRYRELGVRVEPPLTANACAALPDVPDVRALGGVTSGLRGWGIDLSVRPEVDEGYPPFARVVDVAVLGRCLDVGGDGFGNRHLVEPRDAGSRVWFLAHDPDLLALAGRSLAEFLERRLPFVAAVTELEELHHGEGEQPPSPDHEVHFVDPAPLETLTGLDRARPVADLPPNAPAFDFRAAAPGWAIDLARYPLEQLVRCGDVFVFRADAAGRSKKWWRFW